VSFKEVLKPKWLLPFALLVLLSLRIYPAHFGKTIIETCKIFFGSVLYGLGTTLLFNGISVKINKKSLTREKFIKVAIWLAVLTAFSASLDHYFKVFGPGK